MKKLSLLALACLSAINISHAAVAYNNHAGNFYVPINFGLYSPDPERNLDNGIVGSVGLGYNLSNYWAVQANAFGFGMDQTNSPNNNNPGYYLNVEGRFNLANKSIFTPFAVLGAGALKVNQSAFGWDYGAGLDVGLSPSLALDASWRQIRQQGNASPNNAPHDNIFLLGFEWTFGQTPVMVAAPAAPAPVAVAPVNTEASMLAKAQTTLKSILPAGVVLCKGNHVGNQPGCVTFEGNHMIMHLNVKFIVNRANIQNQYGTPIQSLGNFMNAYPNTSVVLYGYASSEGPLAYNQKLSAKRAASVKNYLVTQSNINPSRIQTQGMGIQDPIATNKTAAGRALNRRVEATLPVPAQLVSN